MMVTFLPFELKRAVRILSDVGSQNSSARVASGVISNATPCVWDWPSFCPKGMMVFPLSSCVFPILSILSHLGLESSRCIFPFFNKLELSCLSRVGFRCFKTLSWFWPWPSEKLSAYWFFEGFHQLAS